MPVVRSTAFIEPEMMNQSARRLLCSAAADNSVGLFPSILFHGQLRRLRTKSLSDSIDSSPTAGTSVEAKSKSLPSTVSARYIIVSMTHRFAAAAAGRRCGFAMLNRISA